MLIIPAIDLKDGKVVRFVQGRFNKKVYSHDPVKTAKHWVRQGAKFLHIVDLDGAITGNPKNLEILRSIIREVAVPVEFGGGVRRRAIIEEIIGMGVERLVLGTAAIENSRTFLKEIFKRYKDKIIVSIDASGENIFTRGWRKRAGPQKTLDLAKELKEIGFNKIIYTDTSRDGTLKGPNIMGIKRILRESRLMVIASGGISSISDIQKLKALEKKGLLGIIIGKALYEGRFTLAEALKVT